jgi:integrase
MAKLRYKDISGDTIAIIRSKTENTTKHRLKPILIMLLPEAKRIIEKWGNKVTPDSYVFPILEKSMSLEHEVKVVAQMVQNINKAMRKVAMALEITVPVTTYVARHSFATILKRGGAPIEYISESLGHTNVMTTESYLGSFGNEDRDKFSRILVDL